MFGNRNFFGDSGGHPRIMTPRDWNDRISSFGMDYAVPGQLGGLGQGYVQPNLMYFGNDESWKDRLYKAMRKDPQICKRLEKYAKESRKSQFKRELDKC